MIKKGELPDFEDPIILRAKRGLFTVETAITQIHKDLLQNFSYAIVWGKSVKYSPMKIGLKHILMDEDVIQIVKKNN